MHLVDNPIWLQVTSQCDSQVMSLLVRLKLMVFQLGVKVDIVPDGAESLLSV